MKKLLIAILPLFLSIPLGMALGYYQVKTSQNEMQAKILIVQRTYDGSVELAAGDLIKFQYRQPFMYVEFTDLQADGIFRNGFDGVAIPPTTPPCQEGFLCK